MLTRLIIRNFKRFDEVDIPLDRRVVLVGPNNSGKTTILQALSLWEIAVKKLISEKDGLFGLYMLTAISAHINRLEIFSIQSPDTSYLLKDMDYRLDPDGDANNIFDIIVEGETDSIAWHSNINFKIGNDESIQCDTKKGVQGDIVNLNIPIKLAMLPPMSGLSDREFIKQPGEINFLIGQGQTAQVLRNLCYRVFICDNDKWQKIKNAIHELFGITLLDPEIYSARAEISIQYNEGYVSSPLDISCSGRGVQQTLLLLTFLHLNPGSVLLLDEPDAHLEILRQRQIFNLISDLAEEMDCQIIAATHSEVLLEEAAQRGTVIACVGKPHALNKGDRGQQVLKALREIPWTDYLLAEQMGWVLYLEGSTDLLILQALARHLGHQEAMAALAKPFVRYVSNEPEEARRHFFALREGYPELLGIALFDRLDKRLQEQSPLRETMWLCREIENHFCRKSVLERFTREETLSQLPQEQRIIAMDQAIQAVTSALALDDKDPWSADIKATDEVMDRVFRRYFKTLNIPVLFDKSDYHRLVYHLAPEEFGPEVTEKLDLIARVAALAKPMT